MSKQLDLSRYAGHTPDPWQLKAFPLGEWEVWVNGALLASRRPWPHRAEESAANGRLMNDAPILLAEVERLRADKAALSSALEAATQIVLMCGGELSGADLRAVLAKHGNKS